MGNGLLIYIINLLLVVSHGVVTRCITPDPALLPTWKDYPATHPPNFNGHGQAGK